MTTASTSPGGTFALGGELTVGRAVDGCRPPAVRRGVRRLRLETDPASMATAVRLYQRYGFHTVGAHQTGSIEFLDMELVLGGSESL